MAANILYICNTGTITGGSENQFYNLMMNLDRKRYNPIAVCPSEGIFAEKLRSAGIPTSVLSMPSWRKGRSIPFRRIAAERLTRFVRPMRINLIHSDFWKNYYLWRTGEKLGIPSVSHVRGEIRVERAPKYLFDKVDKIISISERLKRPLLQSGIPPEKIEVIYDGVDVSEFAFEFPKVNVLRRDFSPLRDVLVGIVGRVEPFKRQLDFLRAVEQVLRVRKDVSFLIIGETQSENYLKEIKRFIISKRDIGRYVIFTDFRRDMPEVLSSLDILTTLSGGSVMIEAMACGKPVISAGKISPSESRIVRDGETGFLVPYDDIHAVAKAMLRLIDDAELRYRMGQAGRKRAEDRFDLAQIALETQAVYDDIA